jgi:predicted DCC family thiol-disulfide oxidoreductase YuxK
MIVLYDGVCGLCNGVVQFLLARDPDGRFRFASLQGPFAREALARHGRQPKDLDTVYLIIDRGTERERLLDRGAAAVEMLRALGGPWRAIGVLSLVPARLLDAAYDVVARNRYRYFGKHESCLVPQPRYRDRFIEG